MVILLSLIWIPHKRGSYGVKKHCLIEKNIVLILGFLMMSDVVFGCFFYG